MQDNWDFGFTFEDPEKALETNEEPQLRQEILTKLDAVSELVEANKQFVIAEARNKLKEAENLILPLLYNLRKNPEKEYIHWPNREAVIDAQIEKILTVTRYYEKQ
jgi:Leucine-rich repeat (LRR) protein